MPLRIKILLAGLITLGLGVFVALAFIGGGGKRCTLPDGVEEVFPGCNTSVLGQTQIGARVAEGYRAELALNGVPIPLDQVTSGGQVGSDPDANLAGAAQTNFYFSPPRDGELALRPRNTMTVTFWRIAEGEDAARSFSWLFEAA